MSPSIIHTLLAFPYSSSFGMGVVSCYPRGTAGGTSRTPIRCSTHPFLLFLSSTILDASLNSLPPDTTQAHCEGLAKAWPRTGRKATSRASSSAAALRPARNQPAARLRRCRHATRRRKRARRRRSAPRRAARLVPALADEPVCARVVAGAVALGGHAPGRLADAPLLAPAPAAVRVVHAVHGHAAHARPAPAPARRARLAQLGILALRRGRDGAGKRRGGVLQWAVAVRGPGASCSALSRRF